MNPEGSLLEILLGNKYAIEERNILSLLHAFEKANQCSNYQQNGNHDKKNAFNFHYEVNLKKN